MKLIINLICSVLILATACSRDDEAVTEPPLQTPGPSGPPVETLPPNATYSPSFSGQTRSNGITTTTSIRSTLMTSSLASPWGITSLPDGRLLVTEKQGRIRIVTSAGVVGEPISGVPSVNAAGQGG